MKTNFQDEIIRLKKEAGSDEALARRLDVSINTVRKWRSGAQPYPSPSQLQKLVDGQKITITFEPSE